MTGVGKMPSPSVSLYKLTLPPVMGVLMTGAELAAALKKSESVVKGYKPAR